MHWNKIRSKHIDFLLCDSERLQPLLILELDDYSHERDDRKKRDEFVDNVLLSTGLKTLRVKVSNIYDIDELLAKIDSLIKFESVM
jgi:very-short-patch-repair endonuclease